MAPVISKSSVPVVTSRKVEFVINEINLAIGLEAGTITSKLSIGDVAFAITLANNVGIKLVNISKRACYNC